LVIVPRLATRSPQAFYHLLSIAEVTILNQTPSAFRQLLASPDEQPPAHRLRHVIFGGEALDV
jgi:arthrofactin-type cyclic lipopeptide synthetase C